MSSSTVHKQQLLVRDLATRSVTLYPSNALVVREMNIDLKPGQNEIEVYGLSPTIDESSVKLDGHGAATVTDMTVDLVVNREKFADVYPDDDSDAEDSEDPDDFDPEDDDSEDITRIRKELKDLVAESQRVMDRIATCDLQKEALDKYTNSADATAIKLEALVGQLDLHHKQRMKTLEDRRKAVDEKDEIVKQIKKKRKQLFLADRESRRQERINEKQKEKERQKKQRKIAERKAAKRREKEELQKFWPKKVYKIVVHLDTAIDTPGSSRRTSVTSATFVKSSLHENQEQTETGSSRQVTLELSYVTNDASWKPCYDISLGTEKKTGVITYRAEFENKTAETWTDTKLWLSTSHTHFGGVDEKVPWMHRWPIGLSKHAGVWSCTRSWEESSAASNSQNIKKNENTSNRAELFGDDGSTRVQYYNEGMSLTLDEEVEEEQANYYQSSHQQVQQPHYKERSLQTAKKSLGPQRSSRRGFAQAPVQAQERMSSHIAPSGHAQADLAEFDESFGSHPMPRASALLGGGGGPPIDHEDTSFEDHGLTTTYEVPGSRTLAPSSLTRRHKIATLPFSNLILTSIAVPKLRAAAFLRARLRNPSTSITLLRGSAGITLDGTYLGAQTLPRTSPEELITLPLGVDPAVHISYAKPTIRRSTQGLVPFNKAASQIYSREIVISNSKGTPIELLVLDQVPVSEDEKLKVDIVSPKGLTSENTSVQTGKPTFGRVVGSSNVGTPVENKKWGKAEATLKKDGEVSWTVHLDKASACILPFEYEIKAPSNESVVNK